MEPEPARSRDGTLVLPGLVAVYDGTLTLHAQGPLADLLAEVLGLRPPTPPAEPASPPPGPTPTPAVPHLAARDRVMLGRLAAGATVKELAYERGLSPKTVYARRARAFARLGIATQSELIAVARHQGWPELEATSRAALARLGARAAR